ncbi:uncharacterized protein LOC133194265 [Saccostrea echinata]|uniref:uncharacterized protein LOC133194265 n=1 Tax=Saccostrea echinata TaxID=191078 RepID=UPI002A82DD81|nr:uncharacterized protein LOC133194265 [Saccostrea echinata]
MCEVGLCFGEYFTLVPANTDKRSSYTPILLASAETILYCAALCDVTPSCYSFTFSKNTSTDNCRLLSSSATSAVFTISEPGSKHYKRLIDCSKCFVNYTLSMDNSYDCVLQQESEDPDGWIKGNSNFVLHGNDREFVATTNGCNTTPKYQCLIFYWYSTGPAQLKVTAGSGNSQTTYFTQIVSEGTTVSYQLKQIDIEPSYSSLIRFVGFKTRDSANRAYPLGIYLAKMVDCPCK